MPMPIQRRNSVFIENLDAHLIRTGVLVRCDYDTHRGSAERMPVRAKRRIARHYLFTFDERFLVPHAPHLNVDVNGTAPWRFSALNRALASFCRSWGKLSPIFRRRSLS